MDAVRGARRPFEVDEVFVVGEFQDHELGEVILQEDFLVAFDHAVVLPGVVFEEFLRPLEGIVEQVPKYGPNLVRGRLLVDEYPVHALGPCRADVLCCVVHHDYFAWIDSRFFDDVLEEAQVWLPHALDTGCEGFLEHRPWKIETLDRFEMFLTTDQFMIALRCWRRLTREMLDMM